MTHQIRPRMVKLCQQYTNDEKYWPGEDDEPSMQLYRDVWLPIRDDPEGEPGSFARELCVRRIGHCTVEEHKKVSARNALAHAPVCPRRMLANPAHPIVDDRLPRPPAFADSFKFTPACDPNVRSPPSHFPTTASAGGSVLHDFNCKEDFAALHGEGEEGGTPPTLAFRGEACAALRHIPESVFVNQGSVKALAFELCAEIRSWDSDAWAGLKLLRTLKITGASLTKIPKDAFNGLNSVNKLDLQVNSAACPRLVGAQTGRVLGFQNWAAFAAFHVCRAMRSRSGRRGGQKGCPVSSRSSPLRVQHSRPASMKPTSIPVTAPQAWWAERSVPVARLRRAKIGPAQSALSVAAPTRRKVFVSGGVRKARRGAKRGARRRRRARAKGGRRTASPSSELGEPSACWRCGGAGTWAAGKRPC